PAFVHADAEHVARAERQLAAIGAALAYFGGRALQAQTEVDVRRGVVVVAVAESNVAQRIFHGAGEFEITRTLNALIGRSARIGAAVATPVLAHGAVVARDIRAFDPLHG